ncbi:MAG TPA: recombinase RecT [Sphingobium sp.]|uniref:recombinase RecT n=1 Tax=Sphingobium sp. TaxID=1912891 RepID=UPI002ED291CB
MNTQTTARGRAIATQDTKIDQNIAVIREQQARPTAIQAMAGRLNLSPAKLQETLRNTVFRDANDHEFAALIVVANEYKLNPLTKEIFAFPAKGGGITAVVSVDGWIRITNEHPQFDGIEFNDIVDDAGNIYAIESVIYRRDRSRPIKVTEYMDECKGNGPAWQKTPKRMLRHRALIQGARVAFGFSGIYAEDDEIPIGYIQQDGGELSRNVTPPMRSQIIHDADTGEILDDEDEETARALDAQTYAEVDGHTDEDGPADQQRGETHNGTGGAFTGPDWNAEVEDFRKLIARKELIKDVTSAWTEMQATLTDVPDAMFDACEGIVNARLKGLRKA